MTLNKAKGRMFKSVGWTWNPVAGCTHGCPYCWAKSLTERWGRSFEPQFREHFLKDKMPDDGSWIFVGSMGDIMCDGMKHEWIVKLIEFIDNYDGNNKFLLQTKNPSRFLYWQVETLLRHVQDKIIVGTTFETNRKTFGIAPKPQERYESMLWMKKQGYKIFLSLEPLSDFDATRFVSWINLLNPEAIEIGLENYTTFTTPPPEWKIHYLLNFLKSKGIEYVLKENLRHLEETANEV